MSYPVLVVSRNRRDKRAIWIKHTADSGCVQLRHAVLSSQRIVDVIDGKGKFFEDATVHLSGVCWKTYRKGGVIGLLIAILSLFFATLLVDCAIVAKNDGVQISLGEAKGLILKSARLSSLEHDKSKYRALSKRIASAGGFAKLFDVAARWWD